MVIWTALLLVVCVLRVEDLAANAVWLAFRSTSFREHVESGDARISDPVNRARLYDITGAGKLPWLFVGVKSYKLDRLAERSRLSGRRGRWVSWWIVAHLWKWYGFVPVATALLLATAAASPSSPARGLSLAAFAVLNVGSIIIAMEIVAAMLLHRSWSRFHHQRFFPNDRRRAALAEWSLLAGAFFFALVLLTGMVVSASATHMAFPPVADGVTVESLWQAVQLTFPAGLLGTPTSNNAAEGITAFLASIISFCYALVLIAVVVSATATGSPDDARHADRRSA